MPQNNAKKFTIIKPQIPELHKVIPIVDLEVC